MALAFPALSQEPLHLWRTSASQNNKIALTPASSQQEKKCLQGHDTTLHRAVAPSGFLLHIISELACMRDYAYLYDMAFNDFRISLIGIIVCMYKWPVSFSSCW